MSLFCYPVPPDPSWSSKALRPLKDRRLKITIIIIINMQWTGSSSEQVNDRHTNPVSSLRDEHHSVLTCICENIASIQWASGERKHSSDRLAQPHYHSHRTTNVYSLLISVRVNTQYIRTRAARTQTNVLWTEGKSERNNGNHSVQKTTLKGGNVWDDKIGEMFHFHPQFRRLGTADAEIKVSCLLEPRALNGPFFFYILVYLFCIQWL